MDPERKISDTYTWTNPKGREYVLTPGVDFKIAKSQGTFTFDQHVVTSNGDEWIDCHGGTSGHSMSRAFHPDRISKVLTTATPKRPSPTANPKKRHGLPI